MASRSTLDPELPQPNTAAAITRTFRGYRMALARMGPGELTAELTRINAALETQRRQAMEQAVGKPLSAYLSDLDVLQLRSTPPANPWSSPRDRGSRSPSPPAPSAIELLASSQRLGKRLAVKLVRASAVAKRRSEE